MTHIHNCTFIFPLLWITESHPFLISSDILYNPALLILLRAAVAQLHRAGLQSNRSINPYCTRGKIEIKIHRISPSCPRPKIALQCSIVSLKTPFFSFLIPRLSPAQYSLTVQHRGQKHQSFHFIFHFYYFFAYLYTTVCSTRTASHTYRLI